jgi:hypothetical protein
MNACHRVASRRRARSSRGCAQFDLAADAVPHSPRLLQANLRIDPKRQALFLTLERILQPPPFSAAGGDLQVPAEAVVNPLVFDGGLSRADRQVSQSLFAPPMWGNNGATLAKLGQLSLKCPPFCLDSDGLWRMSADVKKPQSPMRTAVSAFAVY